jgi:serine/threonine protein kinase
MSDNSTARIDPEEAARLLEAAFFFDQNEKESVDSDLDEQLPLVKGYHLTRPLGEGGFGIVYEAEQCSPIRRRVALKILRQGLTTRELLARFEQERQALALMNHPHIARIHDAGETDDGRPFIAMEMVDGTTIDRFPDLDTAEKKVRLLAQVCHAVAHAHHRGVIHRDLKPSNILVTTGADGTPEPKVIDFGIAKALEGPLITRVFFTGMYQMVGTPGYMGPERQSSTPGGQAADTRSDVFALGAVLWELLSGQRPHVVTENETMKVVLPEGEPVPRELRWIAAMATALDMERRYPNAASLAADLEAWLDGKPVRAAAPGYVYLLGKWARRHPWSFASLATTLLALAIAMAVVVLQNRRIGEQLGDLKTAAAENLRQSAEQNFLLGRNAIFSSPLEGILRWQECMRQNPDHLRAKTFLKSAFAQMHLVAFLGESESLPKGNWRDMQISPNGLWVGVRGADEQGLAIWTAPLGGGWKQTTMPTRAKEPWIITNEGEVLDAGKTKCPLVGMRFLRMTRSGYLAAAGANGYGWCNPSGDWQIFPLAQTTSSMVVSADGRTLAVSAGEQIQAIDQSSDTASSFEKLRAAPISAFAISPNGATIAAAWRDGMIQIMKKGHPSREVLHEAAVLDLFLTNDPETLVLRDPQGLAWLDLRQPRPSPAREKSASTAARWCLPVGDSCAVFSAPGGDLRVLDKRGNNVSSWQLPGVVGGEFTAASEDGLTFAALDEPSQRFRWFRMHPAKQIDIETPTVNDGLLCIGDVPPRWHARFQWSSQTSQRRAFSTRSDIPSERDPLRRPRVSGRIDHRRPRKGSS